MRFFWWENNKVSETLSVYRACVHIFGNKSSPAIATYGLRYTTKDHETEDLAAARSFIHDNFYVDDGLGCADTHQEAIKILTDTRNIFSKYKIRLHKIVSPDAAVLSAFPITEIAPDLNSVDLTNSSLQTALGVEWRVDTDSFRLRYQRSSREFTRRGILSINGSIFDPLGLVAPVALRGRLLQRKFVCPRSPALEDRAYDWDDPLPEYHLPEWNSWIDELEYLSLLTIPRCFSQTSSLRKACELHAFADASTEAIGHVIYMRITDENNATQVSFVFANSKVAPRSATSIPRLELCAAVEASQSAAYVASELKGTVDSIHLYSDSEIALGYIRNKERTFSRYVTTRVGMILKNSNPSQWNYISSNENPADRASRPHSAVELSRSEWLSGPDFLNQPQLDLLPELYPALNLPETVPLPRALATKELEPNYVVASVVKKASSWTRAVNIVSFIMEFISRLRKQVFNGDLLQQRATSFLLRETQKESFPSEHNCLLKSTPLPSSNKLLPLAPFMDDHEMIRVGGRLSRSSYPFEEKHPILLPPKHEVTYLIMKHYHERTWHQGRHLTLGALRQAGYYVMKQGRTISKFISACLICRKLRQVPKPQLMSDLPVDRLTQSPPFLHCGVDVFGPYMVHDGQCTRRTTSGKKVWVLLLTCLYSRAVHLELLGSLDVASLKLALRRFTAIRGECTLYRSDCGTNFVGARNIDLNTEKMEGLITSDSDLYRWKFLPPHASHFAGVWERKVGAIKNVLDIALSTLGSRVLSREEFATFIQEAASIVNHTPLGEVSSDPNDPMVVSPMSLLTLRDNSSCQPLAFEEKDLVQFGKHRWRRVQYLADQFWLSWKRDYFSALNIRRKWRKPNRNVCMGDIVVIKEQGPRNRWPLGLVVGVKTNQDGLVRSATVQTGTSATGPPRQMRRAANDLVVITNSENTV